MSNTVTLPRADWNMVVYALEFYTYDHNIEGGSMSCIIDNIQKQLDNQEY